MKKILLLVACACFIATSLLAQITLALQVPQAGILLKPQLWNAVITNSYSSSKQLYIGLTLSKVSTGEPVITALTNQFACPSGTFVVQESSVSPITYDYLTSNVTDRNPEGYLPAGSYVACYSVFEIQENGGTPLAEECIPVTIEPVSPPILNIPFDQEIIHTLLPQFTWIPPTPVDIFSNLNYDFVLVEVQEGQGYADAIQQNLPVYSTNCNDAYLNYPSSALSLDTGKTYAWQITAKNENEFAAQSEIWTFTIKDTILGNGQVSSSFIKLKRDLDASISLSIKNLLVYYENDAGDSSVLYNIYDIDSHSQNQGNAQLVDSGQIILSPGVNLITLFPNQIGNLESGKEYLFQLYTSRNEIWSTKFIYYSTY